MKKPEIITKVKKFYDYLSCQEYLAEKYKDDERFDEEKLWDHLCEYSDVHNDSFFHMNTDTRFTGDDTIAYAKEIFQKEFGIEGETDIKFYVSW